MCGKTTLCLCRYIEPPRGPHSTGLSPVATAQAAFNPFTCARSSGVRPPRYSRPLSVGSRASSSRSRIVFRCYLLSERYIDVIFYPIFHFSVRDQSDFFLRIGTVVTRRSAKCTIRMFIVTGRRHSSRDNFVFLYSVCCDRVHGSNNTHVCWEKKTRGNTITRAGEYQGYYIVLNIRHVIFKSLHFISVHKCLIRFCFLHSWFERKSL